MPSGGIQLKINMTEGAEWKSILRFTLPLMAANVLQQLYNIVDGIIVGNFVGQDALSAVGTCGPLTAFFIALAFGMSVGAGILISQYFGAQQHEALRETVSTTLLLMLGLGVAFTAIGIAVARPVLRTFLLVPDSFLDAAVSYFQIYCVGLLFSFAYNIVSFTLRSVGDSSSTLYFLLIAAVTNVGLDLLFVAVFRWGVAGAAWATNIAQALSAVVSLVYMQRRHALLRFRLRELRFHGDKARLCIRLGVPTTVQQIVVTCGTLAIQRVINSFGNDFIAGMTAANRAYAIARMGVSKDEFLANYYKEYHYTATNGKEMTKKGYDVPVAWVLDAVNLGNTGFERIATPAVLDRSYATTGIAGTDKTRFGRSFIRKVASSTGSYTVYQDTDDSANDFTFTTPSLKK